MATTNPSNLEQFSANRQTNFNNDTTASAALKNLCTSVVNVNGRITLLEAYELWRALLVGAAISTVTDANTSTAVTSSAFTGS